MNSLPVLSVDAYDRAEADGCVELSIPHLMAFRPKAFELVGWPTRVTLEAELLRYVDHNFEDEIAGMFKAGAVFEAAAYRNSFSLDEKELLALIRDRVAEASSSWFGRSVRPVSNVLVQVGPYRIMNQFAKAFGKPQLSVFEVGPGAGYLGAMLAATGHRYASFDITQALYLWQSRLLQAVAGSDFVELAAEPGKIRSIKNGAIATLSARMRGQGASPERENVILSERAMSSARVTHLPWWTYVKMLGGTSVRTDIVYSNSNLGEMSRLAIRHVLTISRHMLADSPIGVFCFVSKGSPAQLSHETIDNEFEIFGYHKVFDKPFTAYTLNPDRAAAVKDAFPGELPYYNPSNRPELVSANEVVPLRRSEAPLDMQLAQWWHGFQPPFVD